MGLCTKMLSTPYIKWNKIFKVKIIVDSRRFEGGLGRQCNEFPRFPM